jgi:hypothetical protein
VRKAAFVAALTQERDRLLQVELACLLGNPLVGLAKDVLRAHVPGRCPIPIETEPLPPAPRAKHNAPVGEREQRLARNEALYREVNERVAEVADRFLEVESQTPVSFICECGAVTCTEPIITSLAEYEAIRSEPTRFAVVPGHELPEIEAVVERHEGYFVVEKHQEDAEEVARETDPRA